MLLNIWRVPYSADMMRRFASSLVAVPHAIIGIARSRRLRALAALPVAAVSTVLTGVLAWSVLTNVLAYPFRAYLGVPNETRDIWSSHYDHSWGGPTLAGAWATHAGLLLVLGLPAFAWAVRGLGTLQVRLTSPTPAAPEPTPVRTPSPYRTVKRVAVVVAAVGVSLGLARLSNAVGIGDNVLWLPHKPVDALALAVALAPLAAVPLVAARRAVR